jgi:hypothetical protein
MLRSFYAAGILLTGLSLAQIIAVCQVRLSNLRLARGVEALQQAGYLAVPNPMVVPQLKAWGTAFGGGLFFAFSLGAALTIFALAAAWCWERLFARSKFFAALLAALWLGSLLALNVKGLNIQASAYFLILPVSIFGMTLRCLPPVAPGPVRRCLARLLPVALLAVLWASQMDAHMFIDFRDDFLLSNPVGLKINAFYYRYTLYPAEVFKSLDQRLLKTCRLEVEDPGTRDGVEAQLRKNDYLVLPGPAPVDLVVSGNGRQLILSRRGRPILTVSTHELLTQPAAVLHRFATATDSHGFFRQATFVGLLAGFPLAVYMLLYALFRCIGGLWLKPPGSRLAASILGFTVGMAFLIPLHWHRIEAPGKAELPAALATPDWHRRLGALRLIYDRRLGLHAYGDYEPLIASPQVPVRYWLAQALGVGRNPNGRADLLTLLQDPHANVVCAALNALGLQRDRRTQPQILERLRTSDHWYVQMYAYRALKAVGWVQPKSK